MKNFLSIGAGPGIGFATAERFAREGFHPVLAARNAARLDGMAAELRGKGMPCDTMPADVRDTAAVRTLVEEVARKWGSVDVLHYNAALLRHATVENLTTEAFLEDMQVDIGGAIVAIQSALPHMGSEQPTILLTGGGFALNPSPDYLSVSIGKAGLRTLAMALFEPFKQRGIHLSILTVRVYVEPGSREAAEIAEQFWQRYRSEPAAWQAETSYP